MKVSEYFRLKGGQVTFPFVDVDIEEDIRLFVDPTMLRLTTSPWHTECQRLVETFFETVLAYIKDNKANTAINLLAEMHEPNEVHLGLSMARSQGKALGIRSATSIWGSLSESRAATSGLLEDLEDTALMVDGIGPDIISDILVNLIRRNLIEFTARMAETYGIPLTTIVLEKPLWNPESRSWIPAGREKVRLPMVENENPILLVPTNIVQRRMIYNTSDYYTNYICPVLQRQEIDARSELVRYLKRDGSPRVYKKDIKTKYPPTKELLVRMTCENPTLIRNYRSDKRGRFNPS